MSTPVESERAQKTTVISASPELCFEVAADIASYQDWVPEISSVEIVEKDSQDRVSKASFIAQSFGRQISYTLAYDYSEAPQILKWSLVKGDIVSELDGSYEFVAVGDKDTEVNYFVSVALSVPLPGFIKRRAEDKLISSALAGFKSHVEAKA